MSTALPYLISAVMAVVVLGIIAGKLIRRIHTLERDLLACTDAMSQMTEIQMELQRKFSGRLENMDERIMELSVPSHDSSLPLERRHQVLALARQGVSLNDIVKRLNAPAGEAELILNLTKYMGGEKSRSGSVKGQVRQYA
jgi:hypothetical protein